MVRTLVRGLHSRCLQGEVILRIQSVGQNRQQKDKNPGWSQSHAFSGKTTKIYDFGIYPENALTPTYFLI